MFTDTIIMNVLSMSLAASFTFVMILFVRKILDKKVDVSKLNLLWIIFIITLIIPINFSSKISIKNYITSTNATVLANLSDAYKIDEDNLIDSVTFLETSKESVYAKRTIYLISGVWLFVAGMLICKDMHIYLSFFKNEKSISSDTLNKILQKQKEKLNIKKNIKIMIQDKVKTPSLYGIINVNILIPSNVLTMDDEELEMIILHELIHYKKTHHMKYLILKLLEDAHWFNPLIKYAGRFIRNDMECIVDSAVVSQKYDRVKYLKTILKLLDYMSHSNAEMNLLPGICEDKNSLERRIVNMKNSTGNTKYAIILLVVAMALISLFTISFASEKSENKEMKINKKESVNLSENNLEKVVTLVKPLKEIKITATFGERVHPIKGDKLFHRGLDMKADEGDEIYAVMDGIVAFTNYETERGNTIRIEHKDGTSSTYAHGLEFLVEPGDEVKAGQAIMKVGATGMATGPHLHFEMENADGELIDINGIFE